MSDSLVIAPAGDNILVRTDDPSVEKSKGGIIIPETVRDKRNYSAQTGVVIAVGPDAYADVDRFPSGPWCRVGQTVLLGRYAGSQLHTIDKSLRIIAPGDVLAVIENPDALPD